MRRMLVLTLVAALALAACSSSSKKKSSSTTTTNANTPVTAQAFSPEEGSTQGVNGTGIVVSLAFRSSDASLLKAKVKATSGARPGTNTSFPGLVVTLSSTAPSLGGAQANLADLFQVGVAQRSDGTTEVLATWVSAKPLFGLDVDSTLEAFVLRGDAPAAVPTDRSSLDVVSNVLTVRFHVSAGTTTTTAAGSATTRTSTTRSTTTTRPSSSTTTEHTSTSTPVTTAP